jgi:polar amino acid transport system substrate-binding protein
VPDQQAGLLQLEQGRIDAIALTSITLNWILEQDPSLDFEVTEPFTPTDAQGNEIYGCGGAVFRQDDDDLVQAFNEELANMIENDELTPLIEQFGFGPETLPPPDLTTEQLCSGNTGG